MPNYTFKIKNLNVANNQQLRIVINNTNANNNLNIGVQQGAYEFYDNKDFRVCLAPFIEIECTDAIEISSLIQTSGQFDFYIDDLLTPFASDITAEQLVTLLEENEFIEIISED